MSDGGRYLLDNQQAEAGQRFNALAALFKPVDLPAHGAPGDRPRMAGAGRWVQAVPACRCGWPPGSGQQARSWRATSTRLGSKERRPMPSSARHRGGPCARRGSIVHARPGPRACRTTRAGHHHHDRGASSRRVAAPRGSGPGAAGVGLSR